MIVFRQLALLRYAVTEEVDRPLCQQTLRAEDVAEEC